MILFRVFIYQNLSLQKTKTKLKINKSENWDIYLISNLNFMRTKKPDLSHQSVEFSSEEQVQFFDLITSLNSIVKMMMLIQC